MDLRTYQKKLNQEKENFGLTAYDPRTLTIKTDPALGYVLEHFNRQIEYALGKNPWEYIVDLWKQVEKPRILSLMSGACGLEISLLRRFNAPCDMECCDFNQDVLEHGRLEAEKLGIIIKTLTQDVNTLKLNGQYHFILAHAALHHVLNLELLLEQLHEHLNDDGVFIVYDSSPRNGQLLWPEQKELITNLWNVLPHKYKFECFDERAMKVVKERAKYWCEYPNRDFRKFAGFECVRSEDIIPLLHKYFQVEKAVEGLCFARRFVDHYFGWCYDLDLERDRTVLDILLVFDDLLLKHEILKPETIFYVLRRRDTQL